MNINPDVVPSTIEEAMTLIRDGLSEDDKKQIRETDRSGAFHFSVGAWLRYIWTMWDFRSRLRCDFVRIGLSHADDISAYLLARICAETRGEVFDTDAFVKRTHEHWSKVIGRPIP